MNIKLGLVQSRLDQDRLIEVYLDWGQTESIKIIEFIQSSWTWPLSSQVLMGLAWFKLGG